MVSNQPLSELGPRYEEVPLAALEAADVTKFVTAMKLECKGVKEADHLGFFHYEQCRLGLGRYEEFMNTIVRFSPGLLRAPANDNRDSIRFTGKESARCR
ncbi:hypothetical protein HT585_30485 [Ensifer sp. HO-A22]|uniref:Uncharacterized protein n=1 Tax=Ensifer oleiphilus TaxID=2742698 RepID=A0A7Y6URL4_9HYPH|nr:hypothetical protein [Ensifer oleiphilus]NVD43199.1 hypothetical protein [Ensifer oleiphilus]